MDDLQIAAGDDTPAINFQAETGVLEVKGESYPEDPVGFYEPLMNWISQYTEEVQGPLTLNITITYINTSSSKCMLDFLEALDNYYESGAKVTINWYYKEDDEDMEETGEEMCEDLELPYTLIPI